MEMDMKGETNGDVNAKNKKKTPQFTHRPTNL